MRRSLSPSRMPMPRNGDHVINVELLTVPRVQRSNPRVNVGAQGSELLYVTKDLFADDFLIGLGQSFHLCDGFLQGFRHVRSIAYRAEFSMRRSIFRRALRITFSRFVR